MSKAEKEGQGGYYRFNLYQFEGYCNFLSHSSVILFFEVMCLALWIESLLLRIA